MGYLSASRGQTEIRMDANEVEGETDQSKGLWFAYLRLYRVNQKTPKNQRTGELISTKPGVDGVDFASIATARKREPCKACKILWRVHVLVSG